MLVILFICNGGIWYVKGQMYVLW